jgi:high-affinity Fe2+/Pb2+ permease
MILKLIGSIVFVLGLLLALFAAVGWFAGKEQGERYVAIFLGALALGLLIVGYRWTRSKHSTSWRSDTATDRQREFAKELGIKFPKNITKGELSDLISRVTGK